MFGADNGPEIMVRGAARALKLQKEYDIVFAGSSLVAQIVLREEALRMKIDPAGLLSRVSVIETNSFVTNTENPKNMVKDRNDTSMVLALEALKSDEEIRAMVTAGSTGCALVGSCFHLGLEKGLLQPALASALPKKGGGYALLLDCGSNIDPQARDLEQYAILGAAFVKRSYGVSDPAIGLLNVGKERGKGTALLQEAYTRIEKSAEEKGYRFLGNLEGGDILSGEADVVVCDGFTGNILLKGFESVGLLSAAFSEEFEQTVSEQKADAGKTETEDYHRQLKDPFNTALEETSVPGSVRIRRYFDYNSQAGAIFLGTRKLIMKAHGAATEDTVCSCILQAVNLDRGRHPAQ